MNEDQELDICTKTGLRKVYCSCEECTKVGSYAQPPPPPPREVIGHLTQVHQETVGHTHRPCPVCAMLYEESLHASASPSASASASPLASCSCSPEDDNAFMRIRDLREDDDVAGRPARRKRRMRSV